MKFDDILGEIGEFGKYQRWVYAMVCIMSLPVAAHQMAQVFLAGQSDHWCDVAAWSDDDCSKWGYTEAQCIESKRNASTPINATEDQAQCTKYIMVDDLVYHPGLNPLNYNNTETIKCNDGWVYDRSQYKSSIAQEFNMVCDDKNLDSLAQSLWFVGVLIGSVLFGAIADRFGRRITLFITLVIQISFGVGVAFSPSFWWFATLRIILGAANMGLFLICFIIGTEMVGPNKRTLAGMSIQIFYSSGYVLLALIAYFIRDWMVLQLVLTLPAVLFFAFFPFLPESPRWLICRGRTEEATTIIEKAAATNNKELPHPLFTKEEMQEQKDAASGPQDSAFDLFRTPNLRIRTINCMFNWFVNTMVYYGLSLSTSDLGANDYIAFGISGAVEIPAVITGIFAIDYMGRRWSMFAYMVFGGVACLITIFTPLGPWRTTVAMLGKFGITASFGIIYVFSAELFPTPVRSAGVGICSMSARVAGILAPYVLLLNEVWEPLPVIIFGILSISAGILILFLPETCGAKLPQTMEEGEVFGTKNAQVIALEEVYRTGWNEEEDENDAIPTVSSSLDTPHENDNGHVNKAFDNNI